MVLCAKATIDKCYGGKSLGRVLFKVVDSSGEIKYGSFIVNIIIETIEQVGPKNLFHIIMDNAKNFRSVEVESWSRSGGC